jgi:transposase
MLAEQADVVIGVDTHRDVHALAVLEARTGGVGHQFQVGACARGYRRALAELEAVRPGARRLWAIEGTGGYGAGLRRFLLARGEHVVEVDRPERRGERTRAKSDPLDAVRAARTALGRKRLAVPRADGLREAIRVLMVARRGAVAQRTQALRQIKALIVTAPDELRQRLRHLSGQTLLVRCARLGTRAGDPAARATASALRALARRALRAADEAAQHERDIAGCIRALAPQLLAEHGVGAISAAQILISYSHQGRVRSEAAFARLGGTAPIPASSGQVVRHRLDRGGDRQLNRALHTIVVVRARSHPETRAYLERRMREGKSAREAVRALKRYVARHIFRLLDAALSP